MIGIRDKVFKAVRQMGSDLNVIRKLPFSPAAKLGQLRSLFFNPNLKRFSSIAGTTPKVTSMPVNVFKKADTGLDILSKGDPKLAKLIAAGLKKTTLDPLKGVAKPRNILGQSSEMILDAVPTQSFPKVGQKLIEKGGAKVATHGALKTSLKTLSRALPFIGTYLDSVAAIEEIKKGNWAAAGLFGAGAVTSLIPGMQGASLGFSLSGIAASVVEDRVKTPNLSMNKKKRNVNVVLAPTDMGDSGNSGSGATNTKVYSVSSIDRNNLNSFTNKNLFSVIA